MFFYISFLRPPPLHAPPVGCIHITPQVANDLRTEPFESVLDIFYSWSQFSTSLTSCKGSITSKPVKKLTTWRQSSAYKEIPVLLPPEIRDGQSWRLILSAQDGYQPHTIDMKGDALGKMPFPVMSMPILFDSRQSKLASAKQEQIERLYKFPIRESESVFLKVTEQTSFDLDKVSMITWPSFKFLTQDRWFQKIWDSGLGLSSWLLDIRHDDIGSIAGSPHLAMLKDALFSRQARRILELGRLIISPSVRRLMNFSHAHRCRDRSCSSYVRCPSLRYSAAS
jgi:hypothetical protein